MKHNIPDRVVKDITTFAGQYDIERVILFGSRARGTHAERSDIDIAASGGDVDSFCLALKENAHSLLSFDIVDLRQNTSEELEREIRRDGIVIYEKNG